MKNSFINYMVFASILIVATSCEKNPEVFNSGNGLNFYYTTPGDTVVSYSFVYAASSTTTDTVWLKVETMGPLSDKDREISIEQVAVGTDDAVAGTHFVPFDDASLKLFLYIPAKTTLDSIPVVLKRDASLKNKVFNLMICIKTNDEFNLINPSRNKVKIVFTDQLARPTRWAYYCTAYFGEYGQVKHKWLIEQTGKKWDDEYISKVLGFTSSSTYTDGTNENYDGGYCTYLNQSMIDKLNVYNAARTAQGLDELKEADGTIVAFQ